MEYANSFGNSNYSWTLFLYPSVYRKSIFQLNTYMLQSFIYLKLYIIHNLLNFDFQLDHLLSLWEISDVSIQSNRLSIHGSFSFSLSRSSIFFGCRDRIAAAISPSFDDKDLISSIKEVSYLPSMNLRSCNADMWKGIVDG